jgi:hypothetical protein
VPSLTSADHYGGRTRIRDDVRRSRSVTADSSWGCPENEWFNQGRHLRRSAWGFSLARTAGAATPSSTTCDDAGEARTARTRTRSGRSGHPRRKNPHTDRGYDDEHRRVRRSCEDGSGTTSDDCTHWRSTSTNHLGDRHVEQVSGQSAPRPPVRFRRSGRADASRPADHHLGPSSSASWNYPCRNFFLRTGLPEGSRLFFIRISFHRGRPVAGDCALPQVAQR